MQVPNSKEDATEILEGVEESEKLNSPKLSLVGGGECDVEDDSVLDVSGKILDFPLEKSLEDTVKGLYVYRNVFNLIPESLGALGQLRTLKFFGNEINLFPSELKNLVGLECLQVKMSSPGFGGLPLHMIKGLKELELSKVPPRPSAFPILSEITSLKCLKKLSIRHFSIRFLPSEIGCLNNLEFLDLSFNKIKNLPSEISYLNDLISLKVAHNKLVELPSALSSLQKLKNLDLSNNRLTSLGSLDLPSMHNLQNLNLKFNKLLNNSSIPAWICCQLGGNDGYTSNGDCTSSIVEMDLYNENNDKSAKFSHKGTHHTLSSLLGGLSSNSRCFATRRSGRRWKRQYYLQQKARQERLNNSRKWKGVDQSDILTVGQNENYQAFSLNILSSDTCAEAASSILCPNDDKALQFTDAENDSSLEGLENSEVCSEEKVSVENCCCVAASEGSENECCENDPSLSSNHKSEEEQHDISSLETPMNLKFKRPSERDLDNPKPCKSCKPANDSLTLSCKYSSISFCTTDDYLLDGFYDAGRDRPFMSMQSYEENIHLDAREVIYLDRDRDEMLDAIVLSAQTMMQHLKHLKQINGVTNDGNQSNVDDLLTASFLALFVSDHFGGSDKSKIVERTRKAVSGSNYENPFVCTCSTGNRGWMDMSAGPMGHVVEDLIFSDMCEKSLQSIKARRNSIIIPIGEVSFGVCRHRALLMKYLCDRMEPPISCELVRGYLDFSPHAWNVILVKRGNSWVRMIVDACHPHDIREEEDQEYFCRYIPLSRSKVPISLGEMHAPGCSFPSLSTYDEIEKSTSSSVVKCKLGSVEAAAKVRTFEVSVSAVDQIRKFEYSWLAEVRMLGALKHSCIIEMYGHQLSCKWIPSVDGEPELRLLQSLIFFEYIKGGSLKSYIEKLSKAGEKSVPVHLALCIARDVACALAAMHSRHIIHRDIKSENILIDLDKKRADGSPLVKLCDFDRAVPLRSSLHTCCIAHFGVPAPDVCVGTPRWMAPEVLQAMHRGNKYGVEVDIWSFGCLLLELLTLQIPYLELSEMQFCDQLKMGKRPRLTDELETLVTLDDSSITLTSMERSKNSEAEQNDLKFLIDLYHQCTQENPSDRPTADNIYESLLARTTKLSG